jgi:Flp pilus assembly protein TadB
MAMQPAQVAQADKRQAALATSQVTQERQEISTAAKAETKPTSMRFCRRQAALKATSLDIMDRTQPQSVVAAVAAAAMYSLITALVAADLVATLTVPTFTLNFPLAISFRFKLDRADKADVATAMVVAAQPDALRFLGSKILISK